MELPFHATLWNPSILTALDKIGASEVKRWIKSNMQEVLPIGLFPENSETDRTTSTRNLRAIHMRLLEQRHQALKDSSLCRSQEKQAN